MKLDADYYMEKLIEIEKGLYRNTKYINAKITIPILKQIARDGAEAQRVADDTAVKNYMDRGILLRTLNINGVRAAIESAAVKWEVKGE